MIEGVLFKDLKTFPDDRGFFRELIKDSDDFAKEGIKQISHSLVYTGVIKAWHAHKEQTQWNYVLNGLILVALHDLRIDSPTFQKTFTFFSGENHNNFIYKFPNGVAHGYKCLNGPMNIVYFTSDLYDVEDELRIPFDDPSINFDWLKTNIK